MCHQNDGDVRLNQYLSRLPDVHAIVYLYQFASAPHFCLVHAVMSFYLPKHVLLIYLTNGMS